VQSSTHKKIVYGALGCAGLVVVLGVVGLLVSHGLGLPSDMVRPEIFTPQQAAAALDSLSHADIPALLRRPPGGAWRMVAPVDTRIVFYIDSGSLDGALFFGDTFPTGSFQRTAWLESAGSVHVRKATTPAPAAEGNSHSDGRSSLMTARALFATASKLSGRYSIDVAVARNAIDSAVEIGRTLEGSTDLWALRAGIRIERDALDVLARDSLLAGGRAGSKRATAPIGTLTDYAATLRTLDRWIAAAGASAASVDTLASWAANDSIPLVARAEFIRAIGLGWALSQLEPSFGIAPHRAEVLDRLRKLALPAPLVAVIDQMPPGSIGMMERLTRANAYRVARMSRITP
jgi:hypothetical protein